MTTPLTMPRQRTLNADKPTNDFVTQISELELTVERSARRLDRAAKLHHRDLARLAVLRHRIGLDVKPVPPVGDLTTAGVPEGWFMGRIIRRERLTNSSKTEGSIVLSAGLAIEWTAGSFYVDTLEPLFSGLPVIVTGTFKDRVLSIAEIRPAPLTYWNDDEIGQYETALTYDSRHIQRVSDARAGLLAQHKNRCQDCAGELSKPSRASLIRHPRGWRLVCRPCKQTWIDAGRPAVTGHSRSQD
jgi:hypothetical protein